MRIVTLIDCYLPGYKHGGPVRTLANLVARSPADLEFLVLTRDRDLGDAAPFPCVPLDTWVDVGRARVRYLPTAKERLLPLAQRIRAARPDVIYSNSFFSRMNVRALLARRLGLLPRVPFVLGPRGELSPGALALKRLKKHAFLRAAAAMGLFDGLRWQASTALERDELTNALGTVGLQLPTGSVMVACDIAAPAAPVTVSRPPKRPGSAHLVFVSRISPKKQLHRVLDLLAGVRGEIQLDVYGPVDDADYWRVCRDKMSALPANVRAVHHGPVEQGSVSDVFGAGDLFVFPTLGENFGHVIAESLRAGCPVALSDRTPWTSAVLDGAGWVLPLADDARWREAVQRCIDMDEGEHALMRERARATRPVGDAEAAEQNFSMFRGAAR